MSRAAKRKQPPTPSQLKHQLHGAATALNFVAQMMEHFPLEFEKRGQDICIQLSEELYHLAPTNVHADSLWKVLLTQRPESGPEAASEAATS